MCRVLILADYQISKRIPCRSDLKEVRIMIFDKIENLDDYFETEPLLKKAKAFLDRFYQEDLADGSYEIDSDRIFASVQSYRTKPQSEESRFEAHKKYIDVQYIVSGIEKIRWADLKTLTETEERYSKGQDIAFYSGNASFDFVLTKGSFLLLYPQDAHMPGLSADKDSNVRKIVFKIIAK